MIQKILVPTDFSTCAGYAADAGKMLAAQFNAEVHLIHATETASTEELDDLRSSIQTLKDKLETAVKGISVKSQILQGKLQEVAQEYIATNDIDFVCMGSHGSSGFNELFIGSNAQKMIRIVEAPLLIIKQPIANFHFNHVVFASSFDSDEKPMFEYCIRFLKETGNTVTQVHLLNINTSSFFSQPSIIVESAMQDFKSLAGGFDTTMHMYRDFSVQAGIEEFSDQVEAELIAISNERKTTLNRILFGSRVEALVNISKYAVLCLSA